jgi:hypothetical protein
MLNLILFGDGLQIMRLTCRLQRQPCLADATRADQGQQATVGPLENNSANFPVIKPHFHVN